MNNGRGIRFIFLMSTIMLGAVVLQGFFNKKPNPQNDPAKADGKADVAKVESQNKQEDQPKADLKNDLADKAAEDNNDAPKPEEKPRAVKDEYVQVGSLDKSGADRFLVTINKLGGTIHRVELNFRNKRTGDHEYRDLVWEGGYLGELEGLDVADGSQIQTVGKGTPASEAGLKPGDTILAVNDEPILTTEGFESYLNNKTKPDTTITLDYKRDGIRKQVEIPLTTKPISIIRPEPEDILSRNEAEKTTFDYPESFVLSLIKPDVDVNSAWPDLDGGMRNTNWEVSQTTDDLIELKFELSQTQLDKVGIQGPITVFKRYKIPALAAEDIQKLDSRSFNLDFEIEVKNDSAVDQKLAYQLNGPTGLTAETWWYANKIHGRQTAIGYIAGARDVVGSTVNDSYIFFGCPELVKNAKKLKYSYICEPLRPIAERQLIFTGVDSHYFNVSLLPVTAEGQIFEVNSLSAFPNNRFGQIPKIPKNVRTQKLVDCTFQMVAPLDLPAGGSVKQNFEIFCGPKEPSVLKHYGLSDVRTFGWFSWCSMVLLSMLHFFYNITFGWSYGLAIVMLTVLVRCFMIPFSRKAALNAQMMQHLAPQMKEITEKYPEDMEKRAAAQRELYKKHNFNPFGGCFMMFFQLPIFYGLYKALNVDIALRDQPLIPGLEWCSNLAAPDQFMFWRDWSWMPPWLGDETGWLGPFLNILPLLTMVLFIAQQKLFTPPATDDQQKLMQRMMTFMMVAMGVMFFKVPAGLCLYFITSSLWGIIERKLLPKPKLDKEKLGLTDPSASPTRADKKAEKLEALKEEQRVAKLDEKKARNAARNKRLKKRGRGDNSDNLDDDN